MKAVIIGGGIIGASIAWRLRLDGVAATVLEGGRLGQEASWAAAGLIGPQAEADVPGPFFDLCMRGKRAFDGIVERLIRESGVDPEYDAHGVLYVAFTAEQRAELTERARWQLAAGAPVEELTSAQARALEPALSAEITYALHMPTNRRVENRKLTQAYINAAVKAGAIFHEGERVEAIVGAGSRATGVRTAAGALHEADVVVNAAGAWAGEIRGLEADAIHFRPVRGQIVCFETRPGLIGRSLFCGDGILVPRRDGRLLAGSVFEEAGFNKSVTLEGLERITRTAHTIVPSLGAIPFREVWAGLRPAADDMMPVIGPSPTLSNVLYAAGHFRSGILLSALTGEAIADLVGGRHPPPEVACCSPARFGPRSESRSNS